MSHRAAGLCLAAMSTLTSRVRACLKGTRPATGLTLRELAKRTVSTEKAVLRALQGLQDRAEAQFSWRHSRYYAGPWLGRDGD